MGPAIDGDTVRVSSEKAFAEFDQTLTTFIKDRNVAAFGRNREPMQSAIKSQHVRISADGKRGRCFLRLQIEYKQFRILFAGGKRQMIFRVAQKSMTSVPAGPGITREPL